MGGIDSPGWLTYKKLFKEGFEAARKHSDEIISASSLNHHQSLPLLTPPVSSRLLCHLQPLLTSCSTVRSRLDLVDGQKSPRLTLSSVSHQTRSSPASLPLESKRLSTCAIVSSSVSLSRRSMTTLSD